MATTPPATATRPGAAAAPSGERACALPSVLFLHPGPVPPSTDPRRNMLYHISGSCRGDLVATSRWRMEEDDARPRRPVRFDSLGNFEYHAQLARELPGLLRTLRTVAYALGTAARLCLRRGRYDVIVAYGPYSLSLVGWVLRLFTGSKLVVEVPGPPTEGFVFDGGLVARLKLLAARRLVPFLLRRADGVRLYYAWQLDDLPGGPFARPYVFPDFVPISLIPTRPTSPPADSGRYVLTLGYPYNRKGVDVLIKAFNRITDRHPDVTLRVVGHCPDRAPYEALAAGNPRIMFSPGVPNAEAIELIAGCTVFALPSRMEGVPRVLIEAMAACKPIVSTSVSGIPAIIEHGRNGLLCAVDDDEALAAHLDRLLGDPEYARQLAEEGHRYVHRELSEERFVERFRAMVEELTAGGAR